MLSPPPSPWDVAPTYTFHAYSPPASPSHPDDDVAPPALSTKRASRLSAPFPTFLYASEPPPVTARNKQRVRPTPAQLADLKTLYALTPHPSRDEREALGRRIGMRYQSVTNWFQNQRSTAKKRAVHHKDMPLSAPPSPPPPPPPAAAATPPPILPQRPRTDPVRDIIAAQRHNPPAHHYHYHHRQERHEQPSVVDLPAPASSTPPGPALPLPLSGSAILPSFTPSSTPPAPITVTLPPAPRTAPLVSSFRSTPFSDPPPPLEPEPILAHRSSKRSRPTPQQLAALRAVHARTASPSIEERTRVGKEIGMELAKVTNWFRNLRQTARKKERRAIELAEDDHPQHRRPHPSDDDAGGPARKRARRWLLDDEETASTANSSSADYDEQHMEEDYDDDDAFHEGEGEDDEDTRREDEPKHEYASELGTESDAAHEAVTPEPHPPARAASTLPTPPSPSASASASRSTSPTVHHHPKSEAASVDDAMLLLAFHSAR